MSLLAIEFGLTAIILALSFGWPGIGKRSFAPIEQWFVRLARRRLLSVAVVGLSALLLRLAILPLYPIPRPFVPDDFGFLLSADTFAHGRLANSTPAMWTHLETIHVSMQPTYVSMYFPSQGLFMALGKVLFGNVWFGILLSSVLMCAALTWMLQAWLPAPWALLGGFLVVLRLGLFSHWINSLHTAGLLAALGGALVLGAMPRLMKGGRLCYGLLMAAGIALLLLTRPYEGFLLCLPVAVVLVRWAVKGKNRPAPAVLARRAALPLLLVMGAVAWLGYYDYRAFGNPLTPPYAVNRSTYATAPYYIWQPLRPLPVYRHASMQRFYEVGEMRYYNYIHSISGYIPGTLWKAGFTLLFFCGFTLLLPLMMLRRALTDRRIRFLVICLLFMLAGLFIENFLLSHYMAPFLAVFYAIGLQCMRHLRHWKPEGKPAGVTLTRLIVVACLLMTCVRVSARPLGIAAPVFPVSNWVWLWYGPEPAGMERARVASALEQIPGDHLAIVHYSPSHEVFDEWIYNDANIDTSRVIWAHDMGPESNRELTSYYAGRKVWLVEPDEKPVRITPYTGTAPAH